MTEGRSDALCRGTRRSIQSFMQPSLRHEIDPAASDGVTQLPRRQTGVGDLLRQTRQSYGGTIQQIAEALRIRGSYLVAIEEARYVDLPGPVYAQGFVRAYATHLGLDADEAVRRFKLETAAFEKPRDLTFPMPLAQRSIPGGSMVLAALILAICGYGVWYYLSTGDRSRPERVTAVPANLLPAPADTSTISTPTTAVAATPPAANVAPAPAPAPAPAQTTSPIATVAVAPTVSGVTMSIPSTTPGQAPPPTTAGSGASTTAATQTASVAPPPPQPAPPPPASTIVPVAAPAASSAGTVGKVYGTEGAGRVAIRVTAESWVQVRDADQALLLTRTLHPGDVYYVPDKPGVTLRTGNASALSITVDGHPAPALSGQLRRNVALDPDKLMAGAAVSD
jgi:cytoskeleton protein RodZ